MSNVKKYGILIFRGETLDAFADDADSLRFDGLTRKEVDLLVRLAFAKGYAVTIWADGGEAEA